MYKKVEYPRYFIYLVPIMCNYIKILFIQSDIQWGFVAPRMVSLHQQPFCQFIILFFLMIFSTISLDQCLTTLVFLKSNVAKIAAYVNWIDISKNEESPSRSDNDVLVHEDTCVYCFSLYHHQRWRFPSGWCDVTSPQDPPVWSDVYLEQTPSPNKFHLPSSIQIYDENKLCYVYWKWIDPTWLISKQSQCTDGWVYGNTRWKHWTPFGLTCCTRRQLCVRRAKRIEIRTDV